MRHLSLLLLFLISGASDLHGEDLTEAEARQALRRSVTFFREQVSVQGGYLWRYSSDLKLREGEGKANQLTAWVQPPGTPTIGEAYLDAYRWTGDAFYLQSARETGMALVAGQLSAGGWDYRIEFDPQQRKKYAYRASRKPGDRNVVTLDDDTTQAALRFLIRLDRELKGQDEAIHEATLYALRKLTEAQYPNGAWPQRFSGPPKPQDFPVLPATYPESWPRKHPKLDYRGYYTFNDNSIADTISLMFKAAEAYQDERYRQAAEKAGGFILLAQMPDPQPAWAQQYNRKMQPAWARRFEPPAVTGGESQGVMRTLLGLYDRTGDKKYLIPIERALKYLKASKIDEGRLARFYELKTNRPLYFTKKYELTYDDGDLPTHYGFQVGARLDRIERQYQQRLRQGPEKSPVQQYRIRPSDSLRRQATDVIKALDERGAWVDKGSLRYHGDEGQVGEIIQSPTFVKNVLILSRFIASFAARE